MDNKGIGSRLARRTGVSRVAAAGGHSKDVASDVAFESRFARSLQGQLLRHSERREVAIFLCDGALWVADFIDGQGTLVDATIWFRFNCGTVASPHARRRMVLESAIPLSEEMVARIARLRESATIRRPGAAARWLVGVSPARVVKTIARFLGRRRTP